MIKIAYSKRRASLMAQLIKNLLAMWETWVRSLGWEDSLEKGMATHSSILAWRIPWTMYITKSQTQLSKFVWFWCFDSEKRRLPRWLSGKEFFATPWTVGLSVHGILQGRILEWVAIPFSRESSQLRDWNRVSCIADRFFTVWATREVSPKWMQNIFRYFDGPYKINNNQ